MMEISEQIRSCTACLDFLPSGVNPVVQLNPDSKILIIGQAPGRRVHETGIPWNDASGRTLRKWLDMDEQTFYDPRQVSIMPMGFCYPGKGVSGDLPPRKECAPHWHQRILSQFKSIPLVILIGQYAQKYYLRDQYPGNLTDAVANYKAYLPEFFALPHPSPRNQSWLKINPWFMEMVIPDLQLEVRKRLGTL